MSKAAFWIFIFGLEWIEFLYILAPQLVHMEASTRGMSVFDLIQSYRPDYSRALVPRFTPLVYTPQYPAYISVSDTETSAATTPPNTPNTEIIVFEAEGGEDNLKVKQEEI